MVDLIDLLDNSMTKKPFSVLGVPFSGHWGLTKMTDLSSIKSNMAWRSAGEDATKARSSAYIGAPQ